MAWTTLKLQVATPLFNGGADPSGKEGFRPDGEAGLRVASIRGGMRFWFRALAGAFAGPDLELLATLERRVFGGIAGPRGGRGPDGSDGPDGEAAVPSPLILRLPAPPALSYETAPDFLRGAHGRWIAYLLGLGLMEMRGSRPHLTRPFVPPDSGDGTFDLKIGFRHDRRATDEVRHAVETLAFASLWLACAYGGFGARTRRGFGAVRIVGGDGDMPRPWTPRSIRTYGPDFYEKPACLWPEPYIRFLGPQLRELAAAEGKELPDPDRWAGPPPYPVLSERFAPAALVPGRTDSWEAALGHGGEQLRLFRANRPLDREKRRQARVKTAEWDEVIKGEFADFPLGALGLPVGFHDKDADSDFTVSAVSTAGEPLRRASPLWLRPVGAKNQWQLFTFAFQGRFLPGSETATVRLLPGGGELFVEQEDMTRLTNRWLATMRGGGDFAADIRD